MLVSEYNRPHDTDKYDSDRTMLSEADAKWAELLYNDVTRSQPLGTGDLHVVRALLEQSLALPPKSLVKTPKYNGVRTARDEVDALMSRMLPVPGDARGALPAEFEMFHLGNTGLPAQIVLRAQLAGPPPQLDSAPLSAAVSQLAASVPLVAGVVTQQAAPPRLPPPPLPPPPPRPQQQQLEQHEAPQAEQAGHQLQVRQQEDSAVGEKVATR